LGEHFRPLLFGVPEEATDIDVGNMFIKRHMFVHTESYSEKYNCMILMMEKLYATVAGECEADNLDSIANQEVLLSGHLYIALLQEKLLDVLIGAKARVIKDMKNNRVDEESMTNSTYLKKIIVDGQVSIGKRMEHFLATGNLISKSNLDLQQTAGFTIVADKLNNTRYLSHFRSIHRGQYFTEMKTTTVRKLLPECWGFMCPVHTPDGTPCGLLNHITLSCFPVASEAQKVNLGSVKKLLVRLGMNAIESDFNLTYPHNYLPILFDGVLLGYIDPTLAG
jgi:DNA-directed RNA polymerase I subunit RPA2